MKRDSIEHAAVAGKKICELDSMEIKNAIDYYLSMITNLSEQIDGLEQNLFECYKREQICQSEM